jgi:hypothetical protein
MRGGFVWLAVPDRPMDWVVRKNGGYCGAVGEAVRRAEAMGWDGMGWDKTEEDKETCFADSTRLHCSVEGGRRGHGRVVGE